MNWFKHIKVFDGKKKNHIAYSESVFGVKDTVNTIRDTHNEWRKLIYAHHEAYAEMRHKYHFEGAKLPHTIPKTE
jgi:hypothetical protein